MRILHVNTSDQGGAAFAAIRLHKALLKNNVESRFLCYVSRNNTFKGKNVFINRTRKSIWKKILVKLKLSEGRSLWDRQTEIIKDQKKGCDNVFSFPETECDITTDANYEWADIIHLHWIGYGFLDYQSFFLKNTKPVIWTLHDMHPFTGGYHYACGTGLSQYDLISTIKNPDSILKKKANENLSVKLKALSRTENMNVVAISKAMKNLSESSLLFNRYKHWLIYNGIDTEVFKPYDKTFARKLFNLPQDKLVLMFVSEDIGNERKGFKILLEALGKLNKNSALSVFVVGNKINGENNLPDIYYAGNIKDERLMALAYSCADVFILPSLEDNLPNTMVEALCCGTPVIAFPNGGMLDVIVDGENGFLCGEASVDCLVGTIAFFINNRNSLKQENIREAAVNSFNDGRQAETYFELYKSCIKL